jgi:hypothetical protein
MWRTVVRARLPVLAGFAGLALAACLGPQQVGAAPVELRNARVMTVDRPAYASGIVHAYAVLRMATTSHGELDVLVAYFGWSQDLPKAGAVCDATVAATPYDGNPARALTAPAVLASALSCEGTAYRVR